MSDQDTEATQPNVNGPEAVYINPGPRMSAILQSWANLELKLASVQLEIDRLNARGLSVEARKLNFSLGDVLRDMEFDVFQAADCLQSEQNMRERIEPWLQMPGNFRDKVQEALQTLHKIDVTVITAAARVREEELNRSAVYQPGSNNPSNN